MSAVLSPPPPIHREPPVTPEAFLTMEDTQGYELVDGRLEDRDVSALASLVARRISTRLANFVEPSNAGWVFESEAAYRCFPDHPTWIRKADVSYLAVAKFPEAELQNGGFIRIAPDLAVEVVSPNDNLYKLDKKVQAYLKAGVQVVWVVNPVERIVQVHRAKGPGVILGEADEIDAEPALPGFRCKIRELLPDLPKPEES